MAALEAGIPKLCGTLTVDGWRRRGAGDAHDRHACARRRSARAGARDRRRHGQGRGDAVARDGDDARGRHDRRRPPNRPCCSAALARRGARARSTASASTAAARRTTPCSCSPNGRAGAVEPARAHRRAHRACAARSPSRWRATPRARPSSSASRSSAPAPTPTRAIAARAVANSQLVQCSLNGGDAYWGRVLSELGASGALHRPRAGRHLVQRRHRVPRRHRVRARRGRARGARWPRPTSTIRCELRLAHGEAHGAHHRPVARVHRREPADVVSDEHRAATARVKTAGEKAHRARRGAAVHPRVLGQDRRHQVRRPRDGATPRSPSCSRPTWC